MLSEARARLANTRGKKAKRKAREKQLGEAKRLASLQKRRELKAAGIEMQRGMRKRKFIDYAKEIPFQRVAPAGFYDVTDERAAQNAAAQRERDTDFEAVRMERVEEKRRDEEDKHEEKKDRKKLKKMMDQNLPQAVLTVSRLNDADPSRRRHDLALPAPQVTTPKRKHTTIRLIATSTKQTKPAKPTTYRGPPGGATTTLRLDIGGPAVCATTRL